MSANLSPPNSSLIAELSFSFQDELTATIQNALGVAVEIAVVEVTKLVGQVLRDVRDQMHETLRDNKSLKYRLQAAELELCAARGEERPVQSIVGYQTSTNSRIQQVHHQLNSLNVSQTAADSGRDAQGVDTNQSLGAKNAEDRFVGFESEVADSNAYLNESFCEIREDGRVCTQDIKPDVLIESTVSHGDEAGRREEDRSKMYPDNHDGVEHFNRACAETNTGHDASRDQADGHPFPEATTKEAEVKCLVEVKVESADLGCSRNSGPHTREDNYCPDSLSLAQTRLLEDWRPEALQLQHNDPDSFTPSTSHSLSDSPIFNPDLPDLDILSSSSGTGHHAGFSKQQQYPARDSAGASTSHQIYSPQTGEVNNMAAAQHMCKICGEKFHLSEDLRRHRSLVHPKDMNKLPKRNLYPPGRSPYHCSLCGRDFNRMEHLKIHQRIHTGERPYACTVCNARFRHSWALTRHFRIHTGEKPYTCTQCDKTFRNCGGLRFHQRTHSMGGLG
ncbi:hypothetical protein DPEC_G00232900 [Dallia pectoralis]|uniref:Uncharacterized protein n=1 Tax=Dallia pectoralis TaxID=75939 RepID=A0ACC2FX82_DALPE|nr:hypothetical protein DPEC_G00232900 [Dallia pectoralis]